MTEVHTPPARLALGGHAPVPAHVGVVVRSTRTRAVRALASLVACWALAPVLFFVPPHIPWVLLAFVAGIYLAWTQWNGQLVVQSFEGACPRCGKPLALKPGSKIRLPHRMTCYECHHHPVLELASRTA